MPKPAWSPNADVSSRGPFFKPLWSYPPPSSLLHHCFMTSSLLQKFLWATTIPAPNYEAKMIITCFWILKDQNRTPLAQLVKNLPGNAGDPGSIPGWGRSPGGGQGNPLQASHLEKPMDKGAWWATIHMVAKSRTGPKQLSLHILPQIAGLNMPWTLGAILSLSRAFYDNTGFLVMCPQSFQH